MSERRAEVVTGVRVSDRPLCAEHEFAAYHGYCLVCGLDSWSPDYRRETERLQRASEYRTASRSS